MAMGKAFIYRDVLEEDLPAEHIRPDPVPMLAGTGVRMLSVEPSLIPAIKEAVRLSTQERDLTARNSA